MQFASFDAIISAENVLAKYGDILFYHALVADHHRRSLPNLQQSSRLSTPSTRSANQTLQHHSHHNSEGRLQQNREVSPRRPNGQGIPTSRLSPQRGVGSGSRQASPGRTLSPARSGIPAPRSGLPRPNTGSRLATPKK